MSKCLSAGVLVLTSLFAITCDSGLDDCKQPCEELGARGCDGKDLVVCTQPSSDCRQFQTVVSCSEYCYEGQCLGSAASCENGCAQSGVRGCRGNELFECMMLDGCTSWVFIRRCDTWCHDARCLEDICRPNCGEMSCGDDGCGGSCGECPDGYHCSSGHCIHETCIPDCSHRQCGLDPDCHFTCGTCAQGQACLDGRCVSACTPGDERPCGMCGAMTCSSAGDWGVCVGEGVCLPDDTKQEGACANGGDAVWKCTSDCVWKMSSCVNQGCINGMTRKDASLECGNCGVQQFQCVGNEWVYHGCVGEGVCSSGDTKTVYETVSNYPSVPPNRMSRKYNCYRCQWVEDFSAAKHCLDWSNWCLGDLLVICQPNGGYSYAQDCRPYCSRNGSPEGYCYASSKFSSSCRCSF